MQENPCQPCFRLLCLEPARILLALRMLVRGLIFALLVGRNHHGNPALGLSLRLSRLLRPSRRGRGRAGSKGQRRPRTQLHARHALSENGALRAHCPFAAPSPHAAQAHGRERRGRVPPDFLARCGAGNRRTLAGNHRAVRRGGHTALLLRRNDGTLAARRLSRALPRTRSGRT